jgi:hypothetical protein
MYIFMGLWNKPIKTQSHLAKKHIFTLMWYILPHVLFFFLYKPIIIY